MMIFSYKTWYTAFKWQSHNCGGVGQKNSMFNKPHLESTMDIMIASELYHVKPFPQHTFPHQSQFKTSLNGVKFY